MKSLFKEKKVEEPIITPVSIYQDKIVVIKYKYEVEEDAPDNEYISTKEFKDNFSKVMKSYWYSYYQTGDYEKMQVVNELMSYFDTNF